MKQYSHRPQRRIRLQVRLKLSGSTVAVLGGCQSMPSSTDVHARISAQAAATRSPGLLDRSGNMQRTGLRAVSGNPRAVDSGGATYEAFESTGETEQAERRERSLSHLHSAISPSMPLLAAECRP